MNEHQTVMLVPLLSLHSLNGVSSSSGFPASLGISIQHVSIPESFNFFSTTYDDHADILTSWRWAITFWMLLRAITAARLHHLIKLHVLWAFPNQCFPLFNLTFWHSWLSTLRIWSSVLLWLLPVHAGLMWEIVPPSPPFKLHVPDWVFLWLNSSYRPSGQEEGGTDPEGKGTHSVLQGRGLCIVFKQGWEC